MCVKIDAEVDLVQNVYLSISVAQVVLSKRSIAVCIIDRAL